LVRQGGTANRTQRVVSNHQAIMNLQALTNG